MKRFFRNLKTLAMVAMVGVATLAVSCSEPYDDTQIKADIEDLKSRVEALEVKLTNEVNTLKALIDSKVAAVEDAIAAVENKIAILDYEQNADGSWTLTGKDGEEITIYPQAKDNGLTVIEENGVYYWAQVNEGVVTPLVDADGNKYALHHATVVPDIEIPECHAEPQVRQDENGQNEVSFDGGKNWYSMGGGDLGLFQSVTVSADGKSLTFVLNNGDSFTTSLPEEFKFGVKSGKQFFQAEQTIVVDLELQAIEEVEVLAKPEGWKASVSANKLSVTAPAAGVGEESGIVKVLAITGENKAAFAKLYVSAGKGYRIEIRDVEGVPSVAILNEMVNEVDYGWEGVYSLHPALYVGMMPKAEFEEMGAVGIAEAISNDMYPYYTSVTDQAMFDPENPVYEVVAPISQLWMDAYWEPLEVVPGVEYIIWATTFTSGASYWDPNVLNPEDMVYTSYVERTLDVKEVSATFNDIQIDVTVEGYTSGYYVLFGQLEYMIGWENNDFAYWQKGWSDFGFVRTETSFKGSLFDFGYDVNGWSEKELGLPGVDYLLLILPIEEGKAVADYTTADVKEFTFRTADLTSGGSVKPTITAAELGYNNVKGQFDAEGAALVYYNYYRAAAWDDKMESWDNETWAAALLTGGIIKNTESFTYNLTGINMNEDVRFAAIAVDKNGKYGEVTVEKFTTKDFAFKAGFTTTLSLTDAEGGKAKVVTPTTTGGEAVKYRYQIISNEWTWNSTYGGNYESAGKYIAIQTNSYYFKEVAVADLVDGAFTVSGLSFGSQYWLVVMPVDAEGNFGEPAGVEFVPVMAGEMVYADEANYEVGKPTLELVSVVCNYTDSSNEEWSEYTMKVKLTPSADADVTYIARFDEEYEDSYPSEWSLMEYVVNKYNPNYDAEYITYGYTLAFEGTEPVELQLYGNDWGGSSIYYGHHIYITWKKTIDGVDWYRECWKLNVREFAGLPTESAAGNGGEAGDGGAVVAPL